MLARKIGFLGGGKIAQAMMVGLVKSGLIETKSLMASVLPSDTGNIQLLKSLGIHITKDNASVVEGSDVVFITLKPDTVTKALKEVKNQSNNKLFLSLAMGIPLSVLEKHLETNSRVIRVMSNLPMTVQCGCSVFVTGSNTTSKDAELAKQLLSSVGSCEEIDEHLLDIATAVAGSGPAFIFLMVESLADGAVKMGMPRDMALRQAIQTVLGSAELMRSSTKHPAQLKDDVASPAGSTIVGLNYLEKNCFRSAVSGAIEMTTLRCEEVTKKWC